MGKLVAIADSDVAYSQLATRIPRRLHRDMKLHCVRDDRSIAAFVAEALRAHLAREERR